MNNEPMYKLSQATKKMQVWSASAEGSQVHVSHGELGGKIQIQTYEAEAKNIGKASETTPSQQAILEVEALYEARYTNKHYRHTQEKALELAKNCGEPRKIHKFQDHGHKLPSKVYISTKFNGSRACILGGELFSKVGRKEEIKVKHIREAVEALGDVDMDCEVYAHGLSLQRIRSAWLKPIRTDKEVIKLAKEKTGDKTIASVEEAVEKLGYNPNDDAKILKLRVFDIPVMNIPFSERIGLMEELENLVEYYELSGAIDFTYPHLEDVEDVNFEMIHNHQMGYEGVVVYSPDDMYEFGKRSYTCQKAKPRLDSEALVVDCTIDKSGQGVLHLQTNDAMGNVSFKGKMKGDAHSRAFDVQKGFIGKWVTYSYEELSDKGVPTKGVVLGARECNEKGEPLE